MALFGAPSSSNKLLSFKAGRMNLREKTVIADKRKGLVSMEYGTVDRLLMLKWSDRATGTVELDLKIFPNEAEFIPVPACTTGRVFLLRFKDTKRKYFFWMQETNDKGDFAIVTKMTSILKSPAPPTSSGGGGLGDLRMPGGLSADRMSHLLSNMDSNQLSQILSLTGGAGGGPGGAGGSGTLADVFGRLSGRSSAASGSSPAFPSALQESLRGLGGTSTAGADSSSSSASSAPFSRSSQSSRPATAPTIRTEAETSRTQPSSSQASTAAGNRVRLEDLQSFFAGNPATAGSAVEGTATAGIPLPAAGALELADVITLERLMPIISIPEVAQQLVTLLPEDGSSPSQSQLTAIVASPQFASALQVFGAALHSGQMAPCMSEFGVGDEVKTSAAAGDVEGFLRALQAASKAKKEDEDEAMDVD